ncbi:hypothetical protein MMC16_007695 [Acarospora aff. strigata]|nr:hypothetical protein [Acarospora aff. strigata]
MNKLHIVLWLLKERNAGPAKPESMSTDTQDMVSVSDILREAPPTDCNGNHEAEEIRCNVVDLAIDNRVDVSDAGGVKKSKQKLNTPNMVL